MLHTVLIAAIVVIVGGYMVFDGVRQLAGLGYVAPGGRLGPWADLLRAMRIDPESTAVAVVFVIYGAVLVAALVYHLLSGPGSSVVLLVVAGLGVWYLPFGTVGCLAIVGLLVWEMVAR